MSPTMTAPSVREALEITAGILQDMIQRGQIVVGITGTNAYYIGEGVMPTIAAALATPPAPTPSAGRDVVNLLQAIVDGFEGKVQFGHLIVENPKATPESIALGGESPDIAITAAEILALLSDAAAIRAEATDVMVKAAHDAKIFLNMTDEGWRKAWRVMAAKAGTRSDAAIRAAAFEEAAKIIDNSCEPESGVEYGLMSESARAERRSRNATKQASAAAIRAAGENAK